MNSSSTTTPPPEQDTFSSSSYNYPEEIAQEAYSNDDDDSNNSTAKNDKNNDTIDHSTKITVEISEPSSTTTTKSSKQPPTSNNNKNSSPATTPEPTSLTSALTSWYSLGGGGGSTTTSSSEVTQDSKNYKTYVQSIDKCLKNFEYSLEWPDLISALTKLNKVISSFNSTFSTPQQTQPLPLPRTNQITKRLSQCLHPNLPSGVHLKTLETFDLIFQGFKTHDYVYLESDLFSFTSGLLPLWSYAAISVKPKLLSIYEEHLLRLGTCLAPALPGIMLSLFNGLVDDGVEHDIKIRIQKILTTLRTSYPTTYNDTIQSLVSLHPSIHLPIITHITSQITPSPYSIPPQTLMELISSPNTLVQRNALELLKTCFSTDYSNLPQPIQIKLTATTLTSLLKRDMSITRRVFSFIEPRQPLVISAIDYLIQSPQTDGTSLTRILSTVLDNPNITILDSIIAPVVKYLMKCEYNVTVAFLSTINSTYLCSHFTAYLFQADTLEELEKRVIIFNYIVKLRLFEFDWEEFFKNLTNVTDDSHLKVILQMARLHYNSHQDAFIAFYVSFMSRYFSIQDFQALRQCNSSLIDNPDCCLIVIQQQQQSQNMNNPPTHLTAEFTSSSFEFVNELVQKSVPDETTQKFIVISACSLHPYTDSCISVFIKFQELISPLVYNTHAVLLVFKHCYYRKYGMLDRLKYPEKYLLSELHSDKELRQVIELDLGGYPLVVLKLVDPSTMGDHPYRRFIAREFVRRNSGLVLSSVLKYLEFQVVVVPPVVVGESLLLSSSSNNKGGLMMRAKSESNLVNDGGGADGGELGQEEEEEELAHANSVVSVAVQDGIVGAESSKKKKKKENSCFYDSKRVSTLLEKINFVIDVYEEFLEKIDLVVLLSKLTVLATIQNCNEAEAVTLEIQTRALGLITRIVRSRGESSHSFVYDSLIGYLNGRESSGDDNDDEEDEENALLWELAAVDVLFEFFRFNLENYKLSLVIQKCLNRRSGSRGLLELNEATQLNWLRCIADNLGSIKNHYNAVVLISFTSVCRNLLEEEGEEEKKKKKKKTRGGDDSSSTMMSHSQDYAFEAVRFLSRLLTHVLRLSDGGSGGGVEESGGGGGGVASSGGGFFGSLFGGSVAKDSVVDEREALRIALLGKLDYLVRICCKWRGIGRVGSEIQQLVRFLMEEHEGRVLDGIVKCFNSSEANSTTSGLEVTCMNLKVSGGKLISSVVGGGAAAAGSSDNYYNNNNNKVVECVRFLVRYIKYDRTIDVGSIVGICRAVIGSSSCREALSLINEYLKCGGGGSSSNNKGVGKELQDLVVKVIEGGVERREFSVLEAYIPAIFDLVWGEVSVVVVGGGGGGGGEDSGSVVSSVASSASVRDQKLIVNVVHGVVVAVLVAVKGSADNSANYTSALRVLEQISHHTYLRKAWKKEIFDLITNNEPTFFYFTPECLAIWKVIVDNLFTQDRSTFSELITRLTQTTQMSTSALSLFSPKDSEIIETRASLLKRLAFVIHSSEKDQYAKYITNIQEKIAEALKIGGGNINSTSSSVNFVNNNIVPAAVNNSVFLCFRVMVLKFNSNILVSLWPIIVHEVVMVLNSLQQTLDDLLQQQQQPHQVEIKQQIQPQTLSLYLQTFKLLNFLFTIPSSDSQIPHFQLYKWAFTKDSSISSSSDQPQQQQSLEEHGGSSSSTAFVPFISKLRTSALALFPRVRWNVPPLRIKRVGSLEELCGAFGCLETVVPECEWEVIDFCGGNNNNNSGGGSPVAGAVVVASSSEPYNSEDNVGNTDL